MYDDSKPRIFIVVDLDAGINYRLRFGRVRDKSNEHFA